MSLNSIFYGIFSKNPETPLLNIMAMLVISSREKVGQHRALFTQSENPSLGSRARDRPTPTGRTSQRVTSLSNNKDSFIKQTHNLLADAEMKTTLNTVGSNCSSTESELNLFIVFVRHFVCLTAVH